MPTSSFRSTTTRTSFEYSTSSSSSTHRRSRSGTRFDEPSSLNRRGKFVNTVRGSGVPDIRLDDLAVELFSSSDFGRVSSSGNERDPTHHRGRSVSRRGSNIAELRNSSGGNGVSDGASRRRRSLSVGSRRTSENEYFQRNQKHMSHVDLSILRKEKPSSQQRELRRCSSQTDLLRSHDGYNSEKHKQELLAEIMFVEDRGKELKQIVGELHPNAKKTTTTRRPTRGRTRSKDRNRMSKQLIDDAYKIIEDFVSSFEETDISSFDGERSDTSSIIRGVMKPIKQYGNIESFKSPWRSDLLPAEMNDVVLPWLKWETSNDVTPLLGSDSNQCHSSSESDRQDAMEELAAAPDQEPSVNTMSSHGSCSPGLANSIALDMEDISKTGDVNSCKNHLLPQVPRRSHIDIDDYLKPPNDTSFLFERWKYRERLNSGCLVICHCDSLDKFFVWNE